MIRTVLSKINRLYYTMSFFQKSIENIITILFFINSLLSKTFLEHKKIIFNLFFKSDPLEISYLIPKIRYKPKIIHKFQPIETPILAII